MKRLHCPLLVLLLVQICLQTVHTKSTHKREISDGDIGHKLKRPFCNAFTGCGGKRSEVPGALSNGGNVQADIDELNREMQDEARLWQSLLAKLVQRRQNQEMNARLY